jgi:hypothetical protein
MAQKGGIQSFADEDAHGEVAPKNAVRLISRAWLNATHNYDYS